MTAQQTENLTAFMKWFITNSSFTASEATYSIASINIGKHAFKQSPDRENESYISDTTFTKTKTNGGYGAIYSSHVIGAFTLTSVTFDGVESGILCCGIHANYD